MIINGKKMLSSKKLRCRHGRDKKLTDEEIELLLLEIAHSFLPTFEEVSDIMDKYIGGLNFQTNLIISKDETKEDYAKGFVYSI